ncbi:unnamed protein product [Phyllotreta striolata]|uniref:THO complex subunit 6 n=1 Tax=Phyllotreta striolata TaxID=444603 RepID=A0A9N9TYT4_PHYSR|nr:unnamed protein product [Phyllotreta striolata]
MLTKDFYSTILSQTFSPCGNYLIAGDTYGRISVFNLSKIVQTDVVLNKEDLTPRNKITINENGQINSLLSTPSFLLVGVSDILGYNWKTIKSTTVQKPQPDWRIEIPNRKDSFENADINVMIHDKEKNHIFIGCGNNNIYVFDLETRRLLKTLNKHTDYLHSLCNNGTDLISGGEDGVVNLWDIRTYKLTNKIVPHSNEAVARPELGKWIGGVSANEDYILCGGGPKLSLWHYRFLTNSTVFPINDRGIHVAEIHKEKILAGGKSRLFYQMSFVGEIVAEIAVSAVTTYSIAHQEHPFNTLCLAGSSPKIDVCANFMYKNQQLSLY